MSPDLYRRIAEAFGELCDLGPDEQAGRLAALDDALRPHVARMLEADARTTAALHTSAERGASAVLAADLAREGDPEAIGPYRVVRLLGTGGMGRVYEAEQPHPRRRVALKVLHPWLRGDRALELFRFEAEALGSLLHPGIPQVYAAGEADGAVYLAMELVRGEPLLDGVARRHLDEHARIEIVARICDAVQHAHDAGILHRDLKPGNVLLTDDGQPKVLDFGIATPLLEARAESAAGLGTLAYASPEQLERGAADVASDVYAAGVMAYELLTGRLPHEVAGLDPTAAADRKRQAPVPTCARNPSLPQDVGWLVDHALSTDPAARPGSLRALARDLRRVRRLEPLEGRGGLGYRAGLFARRHRRALVALVAVLAVLAGAWAVEAWREAERVRAAFRHLEATDARIDALVAHGAWDEAEALFAAYTGLPEHRETPALSDAWRRQALRRRAAGRDDVLPALSEAWIQGVDARTASAAGAELARELARLGRYGSAWEVAAALPPRERAALSDVLLLAATARRDLEWAADHAPAEAAGPLRALSLGRNTGLSSVGARVLDVDGDGDDELVTIEVDDRIVVRSLPDLAPLVDLPHPVDVEVHGPQLGAWGGALWLVTAPAGSQPATLWRAAPGDGPWRAVATLGGGQPHVIDIVDGVAWIGLVYPERGLRTVDLETLEVKVPHPDTDAVESDVFDVRHADVDADGEDEVLVTVVDWAAYDVRVLERAGDGHVMRARRQIGSLTGAAVVPRPGRAPLLAAVTIDRYRNARVFGSERPMGPPPGVYLLELQGDTLAEVGFLPSPLPTDEVTGTTAAAPMVADLDGDGRPELLAAHEDHLGPGTAELLLVPAVAPGAAPLVLPGLDLYDVADLDGDGDEELIARTDDGELWFLGTGHEPCPPWREPIGDRLGPAPSVEPSARRVWQRADALLALGLPEQAARALSTLGELHDAPAVRAASFTAAARLLEELGDDLGASRAWQASLREADDPLVRERAVRSLGRRLRLSEALAIARDLPDDLDWLPAAATAPEVALLPRGALDPRWRLVQPEALRPGPDGWVVDTFNDLGTILATDVEVTGGRLGVTMDLRVDLVELGAGLGVVLVDPEGRTRLSVAVGADGGGGLTNLRAMCLSDDRPRDFHTRLLPAAHAPVELSLRAEWLDGPGLRGCALSGATERVLTAPVAEPLPDGRYELRLTTWGDAAYRPPTRLVATVRELVVRGATWPEAPPLDAAAVGRRALAQGDAEGALPLLEATSDALWAALRTRRVERSRALLSEVDRTTWKHALRREPEVVLPLLAERLDPEAFGALVAESLSEPFSNGAWRADVQRLAALPVLDVVRPTRPATASWMASRAEVLEGARAPSQARRIAEDLLRSASPGHEDASVRAHLVLARLDRDLDPERARAHVAAALALSPSGVVGWDRIGRDPVLAPLLPP